MIPLRHLLVLDIPRDGAGQNRGAHGRAFRAVESPPPPTGCLTSGWCSAGLVDISVLRCVLCWSAWCASCSPFNGYLGCGGETSTTFAGPWRTPQPKPHAASGGGC